MTHDEAIDAAFAQARATADDGWLGEWIAKTLDGGPHEAALREELRRLLSERLIGFGCGSAEFEHPWPRACWEWMWRAGRRGWKC